MTPPPTNKLREASAEKLSDLITEAANRNRRKRSDIVEALLISGISSRVGGINKFFENLIGRKESLGVLACLMCFRVKTFSEFYKSQYDCRYDSWCAECAKELGRLPKSRQFSRLRMELRRRDPEEYKKERARGKCKSAVKSGFIKKPIACASCGLHKKFLQAHHPDYDKPLDVIWLCTRCHKIEHHNMAARALKP